MAGSIGVRGDFAASDLCGLARHCGDVDQVRRLLALAAILEGAGRGEAAKIGIADFEKASPRVWRGSHDASRKERP